MLPTAAEAVLLLSSLRVSDTEEAGSRSRRHSFPFLLSSKPTTVRLWPAERGRERDLLLDKPKKQFVFKNSGVYRGAAGKVVVRTCC